jgi:hypothetical protein
MKLSSLNKTEIQMNTDNNNNLEGTIDTFLGEYKTGMVVYYAELYNQQRKIWELKGEERKDAQYNFYEDHAKTDIALVQQESMKRIIDLIDKDLKSRKIKFIKRITDKVGLDICDSRLTMGVDGSINGTVSGHEDTVNVYSIIAGGYNIQKAHYRVLVK